MLILSLIISTLSLTIHALDCPTGYTEIPANKRLEVTRPFCVMVFPAKAMSKKTNKIDKSGCGDCETGNWANSKDFTPVSKANGIGWRMIDYSNAVAACRSLGENYGLINNKEWMTIANNIENVKTNWSGGEVGKGVISRGHSDNNPSQPCDNQVVNVDKSCEKSGKDPLQKRTFQLSTGEVIWDIAGNLWEWVDWEVEFTRSASPAEAWVEFDIIKPEIETGKEVDLKWIKSLNNPSFNSKQGMGKYWSSSPKGKAIATRSSRWTNGENSGIYTLDLSTSAKLTGKNLTFRCVKR